MPRVTVHHSLRTFIQPADWNLLASLGGPCEVAEGESLIQQGSSVDAVYLILAGSARIVVDTVAGRRVTLAVLGAGHLLGELEALDIVKVASSTTIAAERLTCRRIPRDTFLHLVHTRPGIGAALARALAERLCAADRRRTASASTDVSRQLAALLVEIVGPSTGATEETRVEMTQEDLAGLMSTTRDSTVRALTKLRNHGLVTTGRRAIVLRCTDRLTRYALAGTV